VTGAEALYADMGHFGAPGITLAWITMAYPCLVLQYMGQATHLIERPQDVTSAFYNAVPPSMKWPVIILATLAAIIASQAMITGLFTMLTQAYALRMVPRIQILHTNPNQQGQVYIPEVNWALCVMCIILCVTFKTSTALAGAYGIAVTCTFVVTTCLLGIVLRRVWRWSWPSTLLIFLPMLTVDGLVCTSNLLKIVESGWVPIAIAACVCFVMHTHHWGRKHEEELFAEEAQFEVAMLGAEDGGYPQGFAAPLDFTTVSTVPGLLRILRSSALVRTQTAAAFMTPYEWRVPRTVGTLATTLGCLPEAVVLLSIKFEDVPFVAERDRTNFMAHGEGLFSVVLHFGYAEPISAARFGIHAQLARAAREKVAEYPVLAPLISVETNINDQTLDSVTGRIFAERLRRRNNTVTTAAAAASVISESIVAPVSEPSNRTATASMQESNETSMNADVEMGRDLLPMQLERGATIVLNKLHYAALPEHGALTRLRIHLYSLIILNARKAITFFGLEDGHTMEIAVVRFL